MVTKLINFFNHKNREKNIFKNIKYTRNEVYLHADEKLMPRNRKLLVELELS